MQTKKYHYKFWTFSSFELAYLKPKFEGCLNIEMERDYENVWEWIWNTKRTEKIEFNFSREHNWKTGEYDKPLRIIISADVELEKNKIYYILKLIQNILKQDLIEGEFDLGMRDVSQYRELAKIKYET